MLGETCQAKAKLKSSRRSKLGKIHGGFLEVGQRVGMPMSDLDSIKNSTCPGSECVGRKAQIAEDR